MSTRYARGTEKAVTKNDSALNVNQRSPCKLWPENEPKYAWGKVKCKCICANAREL